MPKSSSSGTCELCKGSFSKIAMTRHFSNCPALKKSGSSAGLRSFHLIVEGGSPKIYWLHLAVPQDTPLSTLDKFLRHTWLECCGHLSAFTIDGHRYALAPMSDGFDSSFQESSMDVPVSHVLRAGTKFIHEYDYGSTTEISLRVQGELETFGKPKNVQLLARNESPQIKCESCDAFATQVCSGCLWQGRGWVCSNCATEHECGEDMLLPVVNSPRVGVCGYAG